jgi:hypothetical protein
MKRPAATLTDRLDELEHHLETWPTRHAHAAADRSFCGLLRACWEAGYGATLLAHRQFLAGAFPCAHAAFQAGVDALWLSLADDYDSQGITIQVFERLEEADLAPLWTRTLPSCRAPKSMRSSSAKERYDAVAATLQREARRFDRRAPGTAKRYESALSSLKDLFERNAARGHRQDHWRGLGRWATVTTLTQCARQKGVDLTPVLPRLITAYALLPSAEHPRTTLPPGLTHLRLRARSEAILGLADIGVEIALVALRLVRGGEPVPRSHQGIPLARRPIPLGYSPVKGGDRISCDLCERMRSPVTLENMPSVKTLHERSERHQLSQRLQPFGVGSGRHWRPLTTADMDVICGLADEQQHLPLKQQVWEIMGRMLRYPR